MSEKPAPKKLKLKVENKVDYKIIGISSHENDYRMVWSINEHLGMQFTRVDNLLVHDIKTGVDMAFSRYEFNDEERYIRYSLISNRCADGFLFPEVKNMDFILQIIGELSPGEFKALEKSVKSVDIISAAYILPSGKLKGIANKLIE